jgi:protein-tyrosine phosphatase
MDSSNLRYLQRMFPGETKFRPFLERNVADPWYTGDFTQTWADITEGCSRILKELT